MNTKAVATHTDDTISTGTLDSQDLPIKTGIESEISDSFLSITSRGCCRKFERLPMWFKLLLQTGLAIFLIIILASWLCVTTSMQVAESVKLKEFADVFKSSMVLMKAIIRERMAIGNYGISGQIGPLKQAQANTDSGVIVFQTITPQVLRLMTLPDLMADYEQNETKLKSTRDDFLSGRISPINYANFITQYSDSTMFVMGNAAGSTQDQELVNLCTMFYRIRVSYGRVRGLGAVALLQSNSSNYDFDLYTSFVQNVGKRVVIERIWMETATQSRVARYKSIVLASEEFKFVAQFENIVLDNPYTYPKLINASTFVMYYDRFMAKTEDLMDVFLQEFYTSTENSRNGGIVLITMTIIIVIVFSTVFSCISICTARTIIGPWRNLNLMQQNVTFKFISKLFMQNIGINKLVDVKLNATNRLPMTLMAVSLEKVWQSINHMSLDNKLLYIGRYNETIFGIIRNFKGLIYNASVDEINICFKEALLAYKCAKTISKTIKRLNEGAQDFPPIQVTIAIHSHKQVDISIIGDNERYQCTVTSVEALQIKKMITFANRFSKSIIVSSIALENMANISHSHFIAKMSVNQDIDHLDIFEIAKDEDNVMKLVSKAASKMVESSFHDALFYLKQVMDQSPKNHLVNYYALECKRCIDRANIELSEMSVTDVFESPLCTRFEEQCLNEKNYENIQTYKLIHLYKSLCASKKFEAAHHLASHDIRKLIEEINITKDMKEELIKRIDAQADEQNLFEKLECETTELMKDPFKRFKQSEQTKKDYIKWKQSGKSATVELH